MIGEALYRYNAELALPFAQQPDTVYWLKIAALVDVPQPVVAPIPPGTTQWGWHNRDYTINNPQASTAPSVVPGEYLDGIVPGTGSPIYHFQDDAVTGILDYTPAGSEWQSDYQPVSDVADELSVREQQRCGSD